MMNDYINFDYRLYQYLKIKGYNITLNFNQISDVNIKK